MALLKRQLKQTHLFNVFYDSKYYDTFVEIKYRHIISKFIKKIIKKTKNKLKLIFLYKIIFPGLSKIYSIKKIDPYKIIFLEMRYNNLSNPFHILFNELYENYNLKLHIHYLQKNNPSKKIQFNNSIKFIKDASNAKYIFLSEASREVSCLYKRKNTKIIQLWHGCGAFKKFGFSTANLIFGANKKTQLKYPFYKNYDLVQVSSKEVVWAYKEAMNIKKDNIVNPIGVSRTDIFFDKSYVKKAKNHLHELFPNSLNKKVILYAPTFRGRVLNGKILNCFDVDAFKKEFGDEYILIMKYHPLIKKRPTILENNNDFAKDLTNLMSIEELLCISDICISDYSSLIFEYSLFEKPLIFYAYDIEEYNDWRGFYYDYNEMTPGPICTKNEEMIDYIKNIDKRFDKNEIIAFKKKFMSACDGKSTQRLMEFTFNNEIEKYKRDIPLEKYDYHLIPSIQDVSNNATIVLDNFYKINLLK